MEYLKGVIARLLSLLLMVINIPVAIIIISISEIVGFIFGFDTDEDIIMTWPIHIVNKFFGGDIVKI